MSRRFLLHYRYRRSGVIPIQKVKVDEGDGMLRTRWYLPIVQFMTIFRKSEGHFHTIVRVIFQGRGGPAEVEGSFFGPSLCWRRRTQLSQAKHTDVSVLCRR